MVSAKKPQTQSAAATARPKASKTVVAKAPTKAAVKTATKTASKTANKAPGKPAAKVATKAATKVATKVATKTATKVPTKSPVKRAAGKATGAASSAAAVATKTASTQAAGSANQGQGKSLTLRGRSVFLVQTTSAGVTVRTAWMSEDKSLREMPAVFPDVNYAVNLLDDLKQQVLKHFSQAAQVGAQAIATQRASEKVTPSSK